MSHSKGWMEQEALPAITFARIPSMAGICSLSFNPCIEDTEFRWDKRNEWDSSGMIQDSVIKPFSWDSSTN